MIRATSVYNRGDTLEQVKFKVTKHVFESFSYLKPTRAMEETARELCIDPKTVKRILEGEGGEYDEVITKIPKANATKARSKKTDKA